MLTALSPAWVFTAARGDAYDPPAGYYTNAIGTGATLKNELYTITSTGFVSRSYGDSRFTLGNLWQDPNNTNNLLEIYEPNSSVSATWDSGVTWNREHIFPQSWLGISVSNSYKGYGSDLFELAPANPSDNSSRGNNADGYFGSTGTPSRGTFGNIAGTDGNTYWDPGPRWHGDIARSLFYMATRYGQGQGTSSNPGNLSLANGPAAKYQMGDLNSLLHWAYQDPVDTFERRKNEYIYSSAINPTYYQGNRNPYIDHPEYIWAVFGTKANTSQISISTPASDGSSSATVNLGRVIAGSAFGTQAFTVNKTGDTPTTFNVTTTSSATTTLAGNGQAFDYNAGSKSMTVGLSSSAVPGAISGSVTVHNSDLTSATTGQGSADGDDVVSISGTAVDHSNASFSSIGDLDHLTINFGSLDAGSGVHTSPFSIANLLSASGFTAGLDLDSITPTGNTSQLYTNLSTFSSLTAGSSNSYLADIDTSTLGTFSSEYTLAVSDENIPGATADTSLVLDLTGSVITGPQNLTWSGNSSIWDVSITPSWNAGSTTFHQGDNVTFDDSNTGTFTVTINTTVQPQSVSVNGSGAYIFNGSAGIANQPSGTTALTQTGTGSLTISTVNTFTGATTIGTGSDSPAFTLSSMGQIASASVVINSGATANINGLLTGTPSITVHGAMTIGANDGVNGTTGSVLVRAVGTLNVTTGATLNLAPIADPSSRTVLVAASLSNTGTIDLANNELILQNTDAGSVFTQLQNGFNAPRGYWDGSTGIVSSSAATDPQHLTTIGYRQSPGGMIDGANTTTSDIIVKLTYYGDADLNGVIDGADYQQIDMGFGTGGTGWSSGDFNYDGVVDGSDYTLIDNAFNQLTAANAAPMALVANPATSLAGQTVPEPASLTALGFLLVSVFPRRRK